MRNGDPSSPGRTAILVLYPMTDVEIDQVRAAGDIIDGRDATHIDSSHPRMDHVRIVLTNGRIGWTRAMAESSPGVRLVHCMGTGHDNVDLCALRERGIFLSNAAGAHSSCVADHALALLLSLIRVVPTLAASAGGRELRRHRLDQLSGRRVGLLGLGSIGTAVARRLEGFDVEIGYHARSQRPAVPHRYFRTPSDLAAWADDLIITLPGGHETRHMVDGDMLGKLGPGYLVNVGRGSVVDSHELARYLREHWLTGAALDVFEEEPDLPAVFRDLDNLLITPHIGGQSLQSRAAMVRHALNVVRCFLRDGRPPPDATIPVPD